MIEKALITKYVCIIKTTGMKLSLAFTFHYMIFLSMAILLNPAIAVRSCEKLNKTKIEKRQTPIARENATELLHGEILFKY